VTAKDFLKKLKEAVGDKPWPTPDVLKDQLGIAFEAEARNRIKSRKLGEIDDRLSFAIKRELYAYGQALIGVLGVADIDRMLFDRVMDGVIKEHNAIQVEEKSARISLAHAKSAKELANAPKGPEASGMCQQDHEGGFTLGQAFGR
jgi:hypothetical protein